ncbi:ERAD-associated protein, partial [Rhizopus stolonifer]
QIYYSGTRDIKKNYKEAIRYFTQIIDKKGPIPKDKAKKKEAKQVGQAAGYLGLMHWRGEGVKADVKTAYRWFQEGLAYDDPISQNAVGLMYKNGIVVEENQRVALHYFKLAATQEYSEAEINLALEYVQDDQTLPVAIELLNKAAESKHLLAYWYLGQLNDQGYTASRSCRVSVHYYKAISEAGDWLHPTIENGFSAYTIGDQENALLYYMLAAERGYEIAQSNVAFLLDPDRRLWDFMPLLTKKTKVKDENAENNAFIYWSRSAHQNNVDARVKMCDYYYKGIGTKTDYEKAAACYRNAAEDYRSPLAYWNLGWMYENGVGVQKDLPLAKRAYDLALENDADAYLPIKLSLLSWWKNWWTLSLTGNNEVTK